MVALTPTTGRRERLAYRLARATLAEVLAELGVVQDDSTAVGLLGKAADVEYRARSKHGEVIVIALPLDDDLTDLVNGRVQPPGGDRADGGDV